MTGIPPATPGCSGDALRAQQVASWPAPRRDQDDREPNWKMLPAEVTDPPFARDRRGLHAADQAAHDFADDQTERIGTLASDDRRRVEIVDQSALSTTNPSHLRQKGAAIMSSQTRMPAA